MTDADKTMNPHFRSDPADVRIRISKSQFESRIIFWLRFLHWRRFALSGHSLVTSGIIGQPTRLPTEKNARTAVFLVFFLSIFGGAQHGAIRRIDT